MLRASLLTIVSAALYGLAFPPIGWSLLGWVALAPFFAALRGLGAGQALLIGWLWGLLAAYALGVWFADSVATYFLQPRVVGFALFLGVASVMVAPYSVLFALVVRRLQQLRTPASVLLVAAAWTASELARGRLFTASPVFIGNPWGLLGYSQAGVGPIVQVASVTGVYGISFAAAALAAGLERIAAAGSAGRARSSAVLAVLPALLCLLHGAWSLARAPASDAPGGAPVLLVQADVAFGSQWRSEYYGRHLGTYLDLTLRGAAEANPAVVFWPESAMSFLFEDEPLYRASIARVLRAIDSELVAGGPRAVPGQPDAFTNSIWRIARDGRALDRYDKQYLIPLAEYRPLGQLDLVRRSFGAVRVYQHGTRVAPIATAVGRAGVVVCNEAMLPEVVSRRVADGAEFLLNPSNDTWLSHPQYVGLQFDIARLRAVEQRRDLVRVSTAGPSAVIDAWGRATVQSRRGEPAALPARVRARSARTPYGRLGDAFAFSCAALTLVAWGLARPRAGR